MLSMTSRWAIANALASSCTATRNCERKAPAGEGTSSGDHERGWRTTRQWSRWISGPHRANRRPSFTDSRKSKNVCNFWGSGTRFGARSNWPSSVSTSLEPGSSLIRKGLICPETVNCLCATISPNRSGENERVTLSCTRRASTSSAPDRRCVGNCLAMPPMVSDWYSARKSAQ